MDADHEFILATKNLMESVKQETRVRILRNVADTFEHVINIYRIRSRTSENDNDRVLSREMAYILETTVKPLVMKEIRGDK